jgi:putative acetyltransferase
MKSTTTWLRPFQEADAAACAQILYTAVHELAGRYYNAEQRTAWAPEVMSADVMIERLRGQQVFIAEDQCGVAGFMSLRAPDELVFAYVRPDCAGKGVAILLHDAVLDAARHCGSQSVWTHASELARQFLEKRGWKVEQRRDFERNGVPIHNYRMSVTL